MGRCANQVEMVLPRLSTWDGLVTQISKLRDTYELKFMIDKGNNIMLNLLKVF